MSDRFEQEIQYWYDNSRTVDPEYIVFNETSPKPTSTDLANNLACVYNRLNLFSKVALKNYKSISEKQKELESRVQNCQEKLESCEELLRKTQSETRKSLQQISTEIQQSKPLTKREVLNLVQEIAEQPKLVEKEALRLTEDLNQKIQKVEHLLHEINLRLCNEESYESLRNSGLQHIHLGIFMIRLHALHRRSARTNALVVLRDTRWEDSRQIIATMEVDLSAGTQLVYTFPDMILSVNDFHNHVEVAIQTHGYDTWQGGESNLLITMALTCRLSNTSYMGFQYNVENVVDHLTTTGITAIPGERKSIKELEGMSWHLKPPEQTSVRCLNEARILEEEPLNKVRRSNKPKRSRQRSREKWSTLGEPSGKWDYYVRYDAPPDITPIEEVAATGWGDEFSDDEVTPGKVTILEERSDWDDDERSGGKVLVIQERLAQNQQEFLDEYLPQWDENLAIQKKESESEWENPFAAKHGENHTILHLSKEENDDDDLPYPKFRNFKQVAAQIIKKHEEHAFPSSQVESTQSYQPPHDSIMGPPVYPPAQQNPQPFYRPDYQFGYPQGKSKIFNGGYGEYYKLTIGLSTQHGTELGYIIFYLLVLPADPGLWSEVISRWESITINRLNNQTWSDNKAKLAFVENLLGESEKLMWQQWRTAYPGAYSALEAIADEPQNITSQVRQLILLEDPCRGSTDEQDRAYKDLDRITCEDTKNLWSFLEDFRQLATKSEDV
ncbi:Orf y [Tanacetum coccineum]|uniref:TPA: Orf y n=1 Tax=Tanacetum coccineum TaxID=301880 RepID=A0ABQ4WXZ5_9ASTR